jgi:hypothetical protein
VFKARPPRVRPIFAEDRDELSREESGVGVLLSSLTKDIERHRKGAVARVKQEHIADAALGHGAEHRIHDIAVWVEEYQSLSAFKVLADEVE